MDSEPNESGAEHLCAGEPPLEVHRGHAERVGAAVAPACRHVVSARTHKQTHILLTIILFGGYYFIPLKKKEVLGHTFGYSTSSGQ